MSSTSRPTTRRSPRLAFCSLVAVIGSYGLAVGTASAHVDPDPAEFVAGESATVALTVEHGCDGSPTVSVQAKFPDGFADLAAVDLEGWTSSVEGQVVSFAGGPLDPETAQAFEFSFTAPTEPGSYAVPFVQSCETGEIAWIEATVEGEAEPEHPAPVLTITEGSPTEEPPSDQGDGEAATTDQAHSDSTDAVHSDGATDSDGATEAPGDSEAPGDTEAVLISPAPDDSDSDSGPNTGVVVGAVVVAGAAGLLVSRRKKPSK